VTFPGVHAFPGGVVDPRDAVAPGATLPADQRWAGAPAGDDASTALPFWVAAVRELFEEVALLLAARDGRRIEGPLDADVLALRARLHARASLADVLASLGLDRSEVLAAISEPAIKERLRSATQTAIERGVFGSPYIIVDGEPFWGTDRLDQVERWLKSGGF